MSGTGNWTRADNIGTLFVMEERDVTTLMTVLFDINARVLEIHEAIFAEEDDDGDSEEPPLGDDDS